MISCLISASVFGAFVVCAAAKPKATVGRINKQAEIQVRLVRFMRLFYRAHGYTASILDRGFGPVVLLDGSVSACKVCFVLYLLFGQLFYGTRPCFKKPIISSAEFALE